MSVTYSTNWMGPISMDWYHKRGLVKYVWKKVDSEFVANLRRLDIGDSYMVEEITTHYCAGRIDIRDDSKEGYDGCDEYSVAPMHAADWCALSYWLANVETVDPWPYEILIEWFEKCYGKKIRWAKDLEDWRHIAQ